MVKQESQTGSTTPSIASRIAKYAYTTPSPVRRAAASQVGPSASTNLSVKAEFDDERQVEEELGQAIPQVSSVVDASHVAGAGSSSSTRRRQAVQPRDDPANGHASPSVRRSARKAVSRRIPTPSESSRGSDSGSSYDTYEGADDNDTDTDEDQEVVDPATTPLRQIQTQTRIRSSRATRADRVLLPGPTSLIAGPTGKKNRRQRAVDTPHVEEDEGQEQARTPAKKAPRGYADPEVYRHLRPLPDILAPDLDVVFCGINPGMKSSKLGHHFAHPTNKFWRALHYSGRLVPTTEDHLLPTEFNYGMTVLVDRPTAEQSELSTHEMRLNALPFTEKLLRLKPRIVCFVGKKIWDVYESVISKTATTASSFPTSGTGRDAVVMKQEQGGEARGGTPIRSVYNPTTPTTTPRRQSRTRTPKVKVPFDWTQPRPFRLPHPTRNGEARAAEQERYTYFWVVPNTSGLERTPLAEQIVLFGHLNTFKQEMLAGQTRQMAYREFDLAGVRKTVDGLQRAAEAKGIPRPPTVQVKAEDRD